MNKAKQTEKEIADKSKVLVKAAEKLIKKWKKERAARKGAASLLSVLLISACACGGRYNEAMIKPVFIPYVEKFLEAANSNHVTVSIETLRIEFGNFSAEQVNVGGVCQHGRGFDVVTMHEGNWNKLSELQRTVTIFHELGHCLLKREHVTQGVQIAPDMPLSLMHPKVGLLADKYALEPLHYAWELFHPGDFAYYGRTGSFKW